MAELDEQFLQSIMLRDPGAAAKGGFAPLMQDYVRLQNEAARRASAPVDTKALQKAGYERALQGQEQQMAGMALATAIPQFQQIAGQTYKQGSEAQGPQEMGEGTFTPGVGYTADPFKAKDRLTRTMQAQAAAASHMAGAYGQQEDREANRAHQAEVLKLQRQQAALAAAKHAQDMAMGKLQKITMPDGSEQLVRVVGNQIVPLTGPGGQTGGATAPGAFPAQVNAKATDAERQASFMLSSLAASARQMDPASVKPGFQESVARALPGALGQTMANVVSPAQRQITHASQTGIVDNLLTLSTGISYTPEQLAAKRTEYMPAYTDKPEQIQAKREKLVDMVRAARYRAGRAWTQDQDRALLEAFPELAGGGGGGATPQRRASDKPPSVGQRVDTYLKD